MSNNFIFCTMHKRTKGNSVHPFRGMTPSRRHKHDASRSSSRAVSTPGSVDSRGRGRSGGDSEEVSTISSEADSFSSNKMDATEVWIKQQESMHLMQQQDKEFERFVKSGLFPNLKMITSDKQLMYDVRPQSLCQWVLAKMNVKPEHKLSFWDNCKDKINKGLKHRRNDINTNMKCRFMSK